MFRLLFILLLFPFGLSSVLINPNSFQFENKNKAAHKIIFNVSLTDPIICPPQEICLVQLELTSSDPRVAAPPFLIWNRTAGDTFNELKQFTLEYLPKEHCKKINGSKFNGTGKDIFTTHTTSASELYGDMSPFFELDLPPTVDTRCGLSLVVILLIIIGSLVVLLSAFMFWNKMKIKNPVLKGVSRLTGMVKYTDAVENSLETSVENGLKF